MMEVIMNKVKPMTWQSHSVDTIRHEFVMLAIRPNSNISDLCRRYQISRKTGYKWITRYHNGGVAALSDKSSQPHFSPLRCSQTQEDMVLKARAKNPAWGGRKLNRWLIEQGKLSVPCPSTITEILRRHGHLTPKEERVYPWKRFERALPNALWQMDFKGDFALLNGRCYPLTVLDDHSRFGIALQACYGARHDAVKTTLVQAFRTYGLPAQINVDNGSPWGYDLRYPVTRIGAWLIRLGISLSHSRPYHPQTNGKIERWHRSLNQEVLKRYMPYYSELHEWQGAFDTWRNLYNCQRPHEALKLAVPASRYQPSDRIYPETLPRVEYEKDDTLRKVDANGKISFRNVMYRIGIGMHGDPVALRETKEDGIWDVYYCHQKVKSINVNQ
jgi:transposase InsO family protein